MKFPIKNISIKTLGIFILNWILVPIHLMMNYNLISKDYHLLTKLEAINLSIILIILISYFIILIYWIIREYVVVWKDIVELTPVIERYILRRLGSLVIVLFLGITGFQIYSKPLSSDLYITYIGAVIVFWYGYKRYERDKELQLIERYTEKYNNIYKEITIKLMDGDGDVYIDKVDFNDIFNLWYEEFCLYSKGYIPEDLWVEWLFWIKQDIKVFVSKTYDQYIKIGKLSEKHDKDYTITSVLTGINSIIPMTYFREIEVKQKIGNGFKKLMLGIIKGEIQKELKMKGINNDKKDWYELLKKSINTLGV